jgi:eukaryotic-like serine/threonine-protein kinase
MSTDPPTTAPELASGRRLDEVLRERRLSMTETLSVMKGICRALAQAHESGVLHLHLSPHAVVVSPDLSTVRLTDFGSTRKESLALTGTLSTGSVSLGAFHYLAPEQTDSSGPAPDHRADLYATGAIFQEMLTGRPPTGKFSLPSQVNGEVPPETDVIVLKCLARNPGGRYATALDLLADLGKLEEALRVRLLSELRGIQKAAGPRRGLLMAGVILLLIALVLAGYFLAR